MPAAHAASLTPVNAVSGVNALSGESPPFVCLGSSDNSSNLSLSRAGMSNVFEYLEALQRFHLVNCFLKSFPTHRPAMQRWNHSIAGHPGSRSLCCQPGKGTHARLLDALKRGAAIPKSLAPNPDD